VIYFTYILHCFGLDCAQCKIQIVFLASGDRLDEAVSGLCIALLRGLWCFRGNIGVLGLNRALEWYLASTVSIVSCLKWGNRVIYFTYILFLFFVSCAQCKIQIVFFGSR